MVKEDLVLPHISDFHSKLSCYDRRAFDIPELVWLIMDQLPYRCVLSLGLTCQAMLVHLRNAEYWERRLKREFQLEGPFPDPRIYYDLMETFIGQNVKFIKESIEAAMNESRFEWVTQAYNLCDPTRTVKLQEKVDEHLSDLT